MGVHPRLQLPNETTPSASINSILPQSDNYVKQEQNNLNLAANEIDESKLKTNSKIQGLEDYTEQDIKDIVIDPIQDITDEIKVKDLKKCKTWFL